VFRTSVPGEDTEDMEAERLGKLLEYADAARLGVHNPVQQKGLGRFLVAKARFVWTVFPH
jgi:hypothetical protein